MIARGIAIALLCAGAILVPLLVAPLGVPFIGATRPERVPFELFGLTGSIALLAIAALEIHQLRDRSLRSLAPIGLFVLIGLQTLAFVTETVERSWDYGCYEQAARALLEGRNFYDNDPTRWIYQYPPLLAQAFALAQRAISALSAPERAWDTLFYLYQCSQVLLVWAAFPLVMRIAIDAGMERVAAAALAAALLLLTDNPLLRTLRWSQINLWVLDAVLLAIVLRARAPLAAGLAVAAGGHLKLYPLALAGAWVLGRQWRAAAGAVVGTAAIFLASTRGGTDLAPWRWFTEWAPRFPPGTFFRDGSLHSVVHNAFSAVEQVVPWRSSPAIEWTFTAIGSTAAAAWIGWRLLRRERAPESPLRHLLQASDAIAFTLLAAPSVWEHHYVLAIPTAIAAVTLRGRERPLAVGAALVAVFALPTFDVFVLSWHRLAGVVALLWMTAPESERRG